MFNVIDTLESPQLLVNETLTVDEHQKVLELLDEMGLKNTAAQFRQDQDNVWACYVICVFLDELAKTQ